MGGALASHVRLAMSLPPPPASVRLVTSAAVQLDIVSDLHLWLIAVWPALHMLQTNVLYFMQMVEKPNFFSVPQLGQMVLAGSLANFLIASSAFGSDMFGLCVTGISTIGWLLLVW
jgi:hypothetical protein